MLLTVKVSIIVADISSNCLGRAYILARVLQRRYDVEVAGPAFSGGVWEPLAGEPLDYRYVPIGYSPVEMRHLRPLARMIDGDVIYANKPLLTSYGLGLSIARRRRIPIVLDIDDWESGFVRTAMKDLSVARRARYLAGSVFRPHLAGSYVSTRLFEGLAGRAHAVTVSNTFLQRRFGGTLVRHGRDTSILNPGAYDKSEMRSRHGMPADATIVMFFGTIQPYKGVEDLVEAVAGIRDDRVVLVFVGVSDDEHSTSLTALADQRLGARVRYFGKQPFGRIPEFLAAADVVVVPQQDSPATAGQMPAKLFDAMAMEVPLVSTTVSDIPEVLDGHGWLARPGSPDDLRRAIQEALGDPGEARRRASAARERHEALYSWDAMEQQLDGIFHQFE